MELYHNNLEVLFTMMYENLRKESKENENRKQITEFDEVWDSIKQEGFVDKIKKNEKFIYSLYSIILDEYVSNSKGEIELGQMWKVFSKLMDNGISPTDEKSGNLYLELAKRVISGSRFASSSNDCYSQIDVVNKTKFLIAGLDSFDTTEYLFYALYKVSRDCEVDAFWAYYADFIKRISSVSHYEKLTYLTLAEQVERKDGLVTIGERKVYGFPIAQMN